MCGKESISFEEYFDKVECYFALKRDKAILLSPEEFEIVEYYYNAGAPLKVIFRAIDRFFERKKKRKRKSQRTYFLTHVKEDIEELWKDYQRKGTGSYLVEGDTETEFALERIDSLLELLKLADNSLEEVKSQTADMLLELKEKCSVLTLEEIEGEMERIFRFAREKIFDILNTELKALAEETEEEIKSLISSMGKEVDEEIVERFKIEIVFEKLNFPQITLFG